MRNQFPNIPAILPPPGQFPLGFRQMVWKWSYPPERIGETVYVPGHGDVKKLLTLDINIPRDDFADTVNRATTTGKAKDLFERNYPCPHKCPGCFNSAALNNPILTFGEIVDILDKAKALGLESIKFLGPGELLANPNLFTIIDTCLERDIVIGIFTKAAVMGNDMLAQHYHGMNSDELTQRLVAYPNVTFLVGGRSFDPDFENKQFIPQNVREVRERFDYHAARNLALERLCIAGMNADLMKQRMVIACSPVTADNINGAFEIYRWGAERNIPVYIPPTMVSGKGHRLEPGAKESQFENAYIDLAVDAYEWTIRRGIMTLPQLEEEGAHPYIGLAPCNQLTHGMYIHYDGEVWRCPGNDTPNYIIHPNVRNSPLVEIWKNSVNYRVNLFNNRCVKDGHSLPHRFYREVVERVRVKLSENV